MLLEIKKRYSDLILDVTVERFRHEVGSHELIAILHLRDGSNLHIRDYRFYDGTRKYSYHWESDSGDFLGRWDNAPHWPELESYPHHFHEANRDNVTDSEVRNLDSLCEIVRERID
ncbi:MAG: hypothetical protein KGZ25_11940 [Planctomycetes bacterium]|nr:hypothetical protein [Planctomycetota bacterium]